MIEGIRPELVLAYFVAVETYKKYNHPTCEILLSSDTHLVLTDPGKATGDMITRDISNRLASLGYFSLRRTSEGLSLRHLGPNDEVPGPTPVDSAS